MYTKVCNANPYTNPGTLFTVADPFVSAQTETIIYRWGTFGVNRVQYLGQIEIFSLFLETSEVAK